MTKQEFEKIVASARLSGKEEMFEIVLDALSSFKDLDCGESDVR